MARHLTRFWTQNVPCFVLTPRGPSHQVQVRRMQMRRRREFPRVGRMTFQENVTLPHTTV